jgi:hypothetical protein
VQAANGGLVPVGLPTPTPSPVQGSGAGANMAACTELPLAIG